MTARQIALALVVVGTTGTVSMLLYQAALKSFATDFLPAALAARVHWWRDHRPAVLRISVALLVLGLAGLLFL